MTYTSKITAMLLTTSLFTVLNLTAAEKQSPEDYKIILLNNCQVVSELAMTSSQVSAYQALQQQEQRMQVLEQPINAIEEQLQEYSSELETLSALAVQETQTSVYINKSYLQEQKAAADKLQQLVSDHQSDFDALQQQGEKIGQLADVFERELAPSVANIKHNQIQIIGPDSTSSDSNCYSGISRI
jgi:chromosome segregation ATPase